LSAYLLTGATGNVGAAVLAKLLESTDHRIFALVRADSIAHGRARLAQALGCLADADTFPRQRIVPMLGDVEKERLGIADADHAMLMRECTNVIHAAGVVRMNLPLPLARRAAVSGAQNVIDFARQLFETGRPCKIEFVSTVGVAGRDHPILREEWVGINHAFHNTYEQAKAVAECTARTAIEKGLPLTVHRPSMVVGDSRTGRVTQYQIFYYLTELLSGRHTRGFLPDLGAASLDVVPSDFVAEAIVCASNDPATAGRILHLCAGPRHAIPLRTLQRVVHERIRAAHGKPFGPHFVPRRAFMAAIALARHVANERSRTRLGTLPMFLEYLESNPEFANERTLAWLTAHRIGVAPYTVFLPPILDRYFHDRG
jgi:thioester reductase-like protein